MANSNSNYVVYIHTTPVNKVYIGITSKRCSIRWHTDGSGYRNGHKHFWNAIQKYGWDNIKHEIVAENLSKEDACKLEQELIAKYKANNSQYGYNQSLGGESGTFGWKQSEETKKKRSESLKGHVGYWRGKKVPKEIVEKRKHPPSNLGKHHSEETRQKMSLAKLGKYVGENSPSYGRIVSEETRRKMSESAKNRPPISQETREKLSQRTKEYWERKHKENAK